MKTIIDDYRGHRVSKECQAFYDGTLAVTKAVRGLRHVRYCQECGFLRPGHSDDCWMMFEPERTIFVGRYTEEAGIRGGADRRESEGDTCGCPTCVLRRRLEQGLYRSASAVVGQPRDSLDFAVSQFAFDIDALRHLDASRQQAARFSNLRPPQVSPYSERDRQRAWREYYRLMDIASYPAVPPGDPLPRDSVPETETDTATNYTEN